MDPLKENSPGVSVAGVDFDSVDLAAKLTMGNVHYDRAESLRVRKKVDWNILPLMCLLYLMQFADKSTLGQSAVLGIIQDNHLSTNQFNWLGTIFYIGYLLFEYPQNLALQRFPVGKWMSINIFVWSVALCSHAACKSFGGLFAARLVLGICESAITSGFLLVTAMFYTRQEQTVRAGYWFLMNGVAIIILGFVSFGVVHTQTSFHPWQWLMIITGVVTLLTSITFWFFFPDSPANAWFLSHDERRIAVARIKDNQAGIENKRFKWNQFHEALRDPKTWLFALIAAFSQIPNSLTNQRQIIVNQFGFTLIQTTLLGCVEGVIEILSIFIAVKAAAHFHNSRSIVGALWTLPSLAGGILVITLPAHHKVGLLLSYWAALWELACFPIMLGWMNIVTAGHTKKITTNAIVLSGYSIANAAGPLMWKAQYKPRNRIPWIVIVTSEFALAFLFLITRVYLHQENLKRDIEVTRNPDSNTNSVKQEDVGQVIDKAFLDLTDGQNHDFRYEL